MEWQCRDAVWADLPDLIRWTIAEFEESEGRACGDCVTVERGVREQLLVCRYFVAMDSSGTVCGALAMERQYSDWNAGYYGVVTFAFVEKRWRRRGVFTALLNFARRNVECVEVRLMVNRENATAIRTYERRGFVVLPYLLMKAPAMLEEESPRTLPSPFLEVCVDSVESARNALAGGAHRLELCSALALGGLTPTVGLVKKVVSLAAPLGVPVMAMIRARAGSDFHFSSDEMDLMMDDVAHLKALGVAGFVVGVLTQALQIDVAQTRRLVELAKPLPCTFHRAFDVCTQPVNGALECVAATGCEWVLSSGRAANALAGAKVLGEMCGAQRSVGVIAGAGITESNVSEVLRACPKLSGVHGSLSRDRHVFDAQSSSARMGASGDATIRVCDANLVAAARHTMQSSQQSTI